MAHGIAAIPRIEVAYVLAPAEFILLCVGRDIPSPSPQPRTVNHERTAFRHGPHAARPGTASAQELEEKRFDLVVSIVGENEGREAKFFRRLFEESPTRGAGGLFGFLGSGAGAGRNEFKFVRSGEFLDEARIGGTFGAPRVVEVEHDRFFSHSDKGVQEHDGIDSSGDADEKSFGQVRQGGEQVASHDKTSQRRRAGNGNLKLQPACATGEPGTQLH